MRDGSAQDEVRAANEPIAILAGSDGAALQQMLAGAGFAARIAGGEEVASGIGTGTASLAILSADDLEPKAAPLIEAVRSQPCWSDFPFLLIGGRDALQRMESLIQDLRNVTLIERPLDPALVTNAVKVGLRSRERQREAERGLRLRESEELYRYAVELSRQMVWTATAEGVLEVGSRFYRLTGLASDQLPREAIHPQDRDRVLHEWRHALETSSPIYTEYRLRLADDHYRHYRTRAAPRRDAEGRVIRWYGTVEDVDRQKRSELERIDLEERYRLAARATSDAIWDLDLATETIEWSDSENAFFGYTADIGPTSLQWWLERIHPDDAQRVSASFHHALDGEDTHWGEHYRFLCADGQWAAVYDRGYIIRDEAGTATRVVGAMSDVTERQRAKAELKRMQAELIQVSRLSAMGAMASTLAHELNQPLTAIASYVRGGLRLLDAGQASPAEVRAALEAAEAGALKAGQIVRGLRELVSRRTATLKTQDLARIVEEANVLAFVDEQAQRVTHKVEIDPAARWVEADSVQVQQVLINLIRNAIQAMAKAPRREILIAARLGEDRMVEVSVADTGEGLSDEARPRLFSAFRSSKQEGMGIGLSISRTIVEAHGGRIWAEDRPEGGAVFRFTLPAAKALTAAERRKVAGA